jgi:hypothetical protein
MGCSQSKEVVPVAEAPESKATQQAPLPQVPPPQQAPPQQAQQAQQPEPQQQEAEEGEKKEEEPEANICLSRDNSGIVKDEMARMAELDAERDTLLEEESARLKVEQEEEERVQLSQLKQAEEDAAAAARLQQQKQEESLRQQCEQEATDTAAAQKLQSASNAEADVAKRAQDQAEKERLKRQQEFDAKEKERLLRKKERCVDAAGKSLLAESLANYNRARTGAGGRVKTQSMMQQQNRLEKEHHQLKMQFQDTDAAFARKMGTELKDAEAQQAKQQEEVEVTTARLQKQQQEELFAKQQAVANHKQKQEEVDSAAARRFEQQQREATRPPAPATPPAATGAATDWACGICTFMNSPKARACEMCNYPNPNPPLEEDAAVARLLEQQLREEEQQQRLEAQQRSQAAAAADEEFAKRLFEEEQRAQQQQTEAATRSAAGATAQLAQPASTSTFSGGGGSSGSSAGSTSTANLAAPAPARAPVSNSNTATVPTASSTSDSTTGRSYDALRSTGRWCTHCKAAIEAGTAFFTIPEGDFHKECLEPYQITKAQKCVHCSLPIYPVPGKWSGRYYDLDEGGAVHSECQEAYDLQQPPPLDRPLDHRPLDQHAASSAAHFNGASTDSASSSTATVDPAAEVRAAKTRATAERRAAEDQVIQEQHARAEAMRVQLEQQREVHRLKQQEADETYVRELLAFEEAKEKEREREKECEEAEKKTKEVKEKERQAKKERNADRAQRREAAAQEQQDWEAEEAARKQARDELQMKRQLQDAAQRQQEMQLPHQQQLEQQGDGGKEDAKPCAHCGEPLQVKGQGNGKVAVFDGGLMVHQTCANAFNKVQAEKQAAELEVDEQMTCPICMERPPRIEFLPCKHRVCTDCGSEWDKTSKRNQGQAQTSTCPFCRAPVQRFQNVGADAAPAPNRCGWCKELVMAIPGKFTGGFYTAAGDTSNGGQEEEQIHFECFEAFIKNQAMTQGHKCAQCNYPIANITIAIDSKEPGQKATTRAFSGRSKTIHDKCSAGANGAGVKVHTECFHEYQQRMLPQCVFCHEIIQQLEGKFSGKYRSVHEDDAKHGSGVGGADVAGSGSGNDAGASGGDLVIGSSDLVPATTEQLQVVEAGASQSSPPTKIVHEECYEGFLCVGANLCEHCQEPVCNIEGKFSGKFYNTLAGNRLALADFEAFMRAEGTWEHSAKQTVEGEVHKECWEDYKTAIKERDSIVHISIST